MRWQQTLMGSLALVASCAQAQWTPGYPDRVFDYDPREIAMLPPYCKHTQDFRDKVPGGGDGTLIQRWRDVLGPTYEHTHHYCWGLMKTNRGNLLVRTDEARRYYLSDAITEFQYVIDRSPPSYPLLPEVLSRKGENLLRLGRESVAMLAFEQALQVKPDYWPPYAHMSDYFKSLGDVGKARELLERGLQNAPNETALKRRLDELSAAASGRRTPGKSN
jgi:hypothetical protein